MKFSIFGSKGFIGSNLVNFLKSQKIECQEVEVNDEKIFEKPLGHVIYCIGITADFRKRPFDTVESHVCLLHKILKKCEFDSFLYLSSTRIYSNSSSTNEDSYLVINPNKFEEIYNISKIMGESICLASEKSNVRIARLSNVVGNYLNKNNFLSSLIHDALINKEILLHTTSESEKDYVHIDDVVKVLYDISSRGKEKIYNVASGRNTQTKEIIDKLKRITECNVFFAENVKEHSFPKINIKKIKEEFNFEPSDFLLKLDDIVLSHNQ